jgi:subtilisin-like proprotein convertase family protein/subtilisin family serine protease
LKGDRFPFKAIAQFPQIQENFMLISFLKQLFFSQSDRTTSKRPSLQVFILEPILTPSGIVDIGDDIFDIDITGDETDFTESHAAVSHQFAPPDFDELEDIPFIETFSLPQVSAQFDSGVFTVGESGEVTIDFLFDGGKFQGELAIFSLDNMEEFEPGSQEFIQEASDRALSNSERGYIVISDKIEEARFSGELGEKSWNSGEYLGEKTFQMRAGDEFGVMFVPKGTIEDIAENPDRGGFSRPLFSLSTANPNDSLQMGQIADVTGEGSTFVLEDMRIDDRSDRDYNDFIFRVKGATGEAIALDEVIDPDSDWRGTEDGEALIDYANFDGKEISIVENLPDPVKYAIERSVEPENYDPDILADNHQWVVGVSNHEIVPDLLTLLDAENVGATRHIPNSYIWEFSEGVNSGQVLAQMENLSGVEFAYPLVPHELELRNSLPDDTHLWHLHNTGQTGGTPGASVRIDNLWQDGITGKGITIGIVDDGLDYNHSDLSQNYRADLSRDFEYKSGGVYETDAAPDFILDSHGTTMAGIAAGNGDLDGSKGAAPDAFVVGLRLNPDRPPTLGPTDLEEADTLSYLNDDIDIYNNSWGPIDDGTQLQAPDPLTQMVLHTGISQGREGRGSIFVWAGGNGAKANVSTYPEYYGSDRVDFDGYANSRYVVAVAAIDHNDKQAPYSESGSSLLISAYSGNKLLLSGQTSSDNIGLYSTHSNPDNFDPDTGEFVPYTKFASGTSSAAALTSGVVALMLDANPNLTWRDVQHILVETARKNDPTDPGWTKNQAGYEHNYKYGFGAIDAEAAVNLALAEDWQSVGREWMLTSGEIEVNESIPENGSVPSSTVEITDDITVEKVEVMFDATHEERGDLKVVLTSPDGTESILAAPRPNDEGDDYSKWLFTSARHWGESSRGEWKLEVFDEDGNTVEGTWNKWKLNLYGSKPSISIEASDPDAKEGENNGEFTIKRTGNMKEPLTVHYTFERGHHWSRPAATNGTDYELLSKSITIPAGESEVKIPINPLDDDLTEWPEVVRLKIAEDRESNGDEKADEDKNYEVSTTDMAAVTIWDNEKPLVWVLTDWSSKYGNIGDRASEGGQNGYFWFRRWGDLDQELTVNYSLVTDVDEETFNNVFKPVNKGVDYATFMNDFNPAEATDYTISPRNPSEPFTFDPVTGTGTVTFASGRWEKSGGWLTPVDDSEEETMETVLVRVNPNSDYITRPQYSGRTPNEVPIEIDDNDLIPTVDVEVTQHASEDGTVAKVTFTRNGVSLDQPLTINYWDSHWWLKAIPNVDYEVYYGNQEVTDDYVVLGKPETNQDDRLEGSIVIPKGETSVSLEIKPIDDDLYEPTNERVGIRLKESENYSFGKVAAVDAWIYDNDKTEVEWIKQLGSTKFNPTTGITTEAFDSATGVAVDKNGYIYITGRTAGDLAGQDSDSGTNQGIGDAFVAKYDDSGTLIWKRQMGTVGFDETKSISVDDSGNVYLSGWTDGNQTTKGSRDVWMVKYTQDGDFQWQEFLGESAIDTATNNNLGYDIGNGAMTVGNDGNLYVTGYTFGNLGGSPEGEADAWLAKYNENGQQVWIQQLGSSRWDETQSVTADKFGNVYITGHTNGDLAGTHAGDKDAWLAKYNEHGQQIWKQQLGTITTDEALGISVDDANAADETQVRINLTGSTEGWLGEAMDTTKVNVYDWKDASAVWKAIHGDKSGMGGTYHGEGDAWIAQFAADGTPNWKRLLGTEKAEVGTGVSTDAQGNIYITGHTQGKLGDSHNGGKDAFVAMYNVDGAFQWKHQLGSAGEDIANAIALGNDSIYVAGVTSGNLDGTGSNQGGDDAWLAKLS